MAEAPEKRCALCGAALEGVAEDATGEFECRRCGTGVRCDGVNLVAINIPNFHARLMELESLNNDLVREIQMEGMKGEYRDMDYLQRKHLQRQDVLAEYAFLTHFSEFVDKW